MPHCDDGLCSELGNGSIDCNEDVLRGAAEKLRGRFQEKAITERTVRGLRRIHREP